MLRRARFGRAAAWRLAFARIALDNLTAGCGGAFSGLRSEHDLHCGAGPRQEPKSPGVDREVDSSILFYSFNSALEIAIGNGPCSAKSLLRISFRD
jgi:hypothetical protein